MRLLLQLTAGPNTDYNKNYTLLGSFTFTWSLKMQKSKAKKWTDLPWALSPSIWIADNSQSVMIVWYLKPEFRWCCSLAWAADENTVYIKQIRMHTVYTNAGLGTSRASTTCVMWPSKSSEWNSFSPLALYCASLIAKVRQPGCYWRTLRHVTDARRL